MTGKNKFYTGFRSAMVSSLDDSQAQLSTPALIECLQERDLLWCPVENRLHDIFHVSTLIYTSMLRIGHCCFQFFLSHHTQCVNEY